MKYPEKILQIGEGNFLRAFVEPLVEAANKAGTLNGSMVIVPPRRWENCAKLMAQDCRYTVWTRGKQNGEIVDEKQTITCVSRCLDRTDPELLRLACSPELELIVSNTTEAGIYYCKGASLDSACNSGYAALLTRLLWERFRNGGSGLCILPCELIERNGQTLLHCVLQYARDFLLPENFSDWLRENCTFCDTLVDRIVTGFPGEAMTDDPMTVVCEPFFFWAIECKKPCAAMKKLQNCGFDVHVCEDIAPYRMRKVRLLNGMHTASAAAAFCCGISIVRDMVSDEVFRKFLSLYAARVLALTPMDKAELQAFADAVFERFENPFVDHALQSICLNTISKFNARCKAMMLYKDSQTEKLLCFTLAAILMFLRTETSVVRDDPAVIEFANRNYSADAALISDYLRFFDLPQYAKQVRDLYRKMQQDGIYKVLSQLEAELCL